MFDKIKKGQLVRLSISKDSHKPIREDVGILIGKLKKDAVILLRLINPCEINSDGISFIASRYITKVEEISFEELRDNPDLKKYYDFGKKPEKLTHSLKEIRIFAKYLTGR